MSNDWAKNGFMIAIIQLSNHCQIWLTGCIQLSMIDLQHKVCSSQQLEQWNICGTSQVQRNELVKVKTYKAVPCLSPWKHQVWKNKFFQYVLFFSKLRSSNWTSAGAIFYITKKAYILYVWHSGRPNFSLLSYTQRNRFQPLQNPR